MVFNSSVMEGDDAETRFIIDYILHYGRPNVIVFADAFQNMREHWDVSVNDLKIDVKARRRTSRSGDFSSNYFIFELLNVSGKSGWGRGLADSICYETEESWLMVDRERLLQHVLLMTFSFVSEPLERFSGEYLLYSRRGRKDLFTWVPLADMKQFVLFEVNKDYSKTKTSGNI
jgi:hypothetical protein